MRQRQPNASNASNTSARAWKKKKENKMPRMWAIPQCEPGNKKEQKCCLSRHNTRMRDVCMYVCEMYVCLYARSLSASLGKNHLNVSLSPSKEKELKIHKKWELKIHKKWISLSPIHLPKPLNPIPPKLVTQMFFFLIGPMSQFLICFWKFSRRTPYLSSEIM